jgi:hypothetical protein
MFLDIQMDIGSMERLQRGGMGCVFMFVFCSLLEVPAIPSQGVIVGVNHYQGGSVGRKALNLKQCILAQMNAEGLLILGCKRALKYFPMLQTE